MTTIALEKHTTRSKVPGKSPRQVLSTWADRFHERRRLATMPDHLLRDIGIDRASANQEARKPFWQE